MDAAYAKGTSQLLGNGRENAAISAGTEKARLPGYIALYMGMGGSVKLLQTVCERETPVKWRFTLARRPVRQLHAGAHWVHGGDPCFGATLARRPRALQRAH